MSAHARGVESLEIRIDCLIPLGDYVPGGNRSPRRCCGSRTQRRRIPRLLSRRHHAGRGGGYVGGEYIAEQRSIDVEKPRRVRTKRGAQRRAELAEKCSNRFACIWS